MKNYHQNRVKVIEGSQIKHNFLRDFTRVAYFSSHFHLFYHPFYLLASQVHLICDLLVGQNAHISNQRSYTEQMVKTTKTRGTVTKITREQRKESEDMRLKFCFKEKHKLPCFRLCFQHS